MRIGPNKNLSNTIRVSSDNILVTYKYLLSASRTVVKEAGNPAIPGAPLSPLSPTKSSR